MAERKSTKKAEIRQRQRDKRAVRSLRTARRSMMYIVRTLLFITVGGILCLAAFMTCERISNLYILASEGMSLRADCVLADGAKNDLSEYFTTSCMEADAALRSETWNHYTVSSYDYDLSVERINVLPWSMTAAVTVLERVSVKGSINADRLSEGESAADYPVPQWTPARYKLHFVNSGARWRIASIELIEENPAGKPLNTPDPNLTPRPMATPTPTPTPAL